MGALARQARRLLLVTALPGIIIAGSSAAIAQVKEPNACNWPTGDDTPTENDTPIGDNTTTETRAAAIDVKAAPIGRYNPQCLAHGAGTGQIGVGVTGNIGGSLVQQMATAAIEANPAIGGGGGYGGGGAPGYNAMPISMFMVSGVTKLSHDGYAMTMGGLPYGSTPNYDELDTGFTLGLRLDGSKGFGLAPNTLTFGLFGNYTRTDIDLGTTTDMAALYPKMGKVDVNSWSVGGYGLLTDGWKYGMVTVSGTFGSPDTKDYVYGSSASFNTVGISTSAMTGLIVPLGGAKLDLRGGLTYITVTGDDHTDSLGIHYSDAKLEDLSGSLSARLFGVVNTGEGVLRPFIQGGVSQRFHYKSEVTVEGTPFTFNDADTTLFARAGVDFDISRATQAYISVRGDKSEDMQAIAGQVGITLKLD